MMVYSLLKSIFEISNTLLFCNYNIITSLFNWFGLAIEHGRSEVFHFSKSHGNFDSPPLDLSLLGDSVLEMKDIWKYLSFIFNIKLIFHQHIQTYSNKNKVFSTVKGMKMLGNSMLLRSLTVDFIFIFSFYFILLFFFFFVYFLFLEQLRLRFISHAVTSVTK